MPILENKTGQGLFFGPETTWHIRVCIHLDELPFSPRQGAKSKHSWATQSSKPGLSLSENVSWHRTHVPCPVLGDTSGQTITLSHQAKHPGAVNIHEHPGHHVK